jgi:hypothetical protein
MKMLHETVFFPPKEKAVKKIKAFFVKKTLLFERSEFKVFRKKV